MNFFGFVIVVVVTLAGELSDHLSATPFSVCSRGAFAA
jgi:hypothetical protein